MCKYGQAEYAYYMLRQTAEKMLENGVLTEEQFKHLDELNKRDCFSQFCTVLEV
ncbi:SHOCT domain-containing protein [Porcipelethomonas sp.]|uniref:SHOCT domain-containing protein n=1 Tax=Porcipelethomonas sp. TaxID=2981675 RepID=UPI0030775EA7